MRKRTKCKNSDNLSTENEDSYETPCAKYYNPIQNTSLFSDYF